MATSQKLLTPAQVSKCKKFVASESDFSSRAASLLAIHGGASQAEAANQTNLTIGQVRYWVAKFRRIGMAAFPETTTNATNVGKTEPVPEKANKKTKKTKSKDKAKKKTKDDKKKNKEKKAKKANSDKKEKKKDKGKKKAKKK